MKPYHIILPAISLISVSANARIVSKSDTTKKTTATSVFTQIEQVPEFPGGFEVFGTFIGRNLRYPEIARLMGVNGKVNVSFVVDSTGTVTNIIPENCIGAGCEAEAVKVLTGSPRWKPGIQNGKPVNVKFTVPIAFNTPTVKTTLRSLQNSQYGFVFEINGSRYTIIEAQEILGNNFDSTNVDIAEPFYNADHNEKFNMPDKKGVYLVKMKAK